MPKKVKKPAPKKRRSKSEQALYVPRVAADSQQRQLKPAPYRRFRLHNRNRPEAAPIINSFKLLKQAVLTLQKQWKLFLGIVLVYGVLNVLFVHGLASNGNLSQLKQVLSGRSAKTSTVGRGFTLLVYLVGGSSSASTSTASAGVYQTLLLIISSLVLIWTLRQVYNNLRPRIRDGFYKGMTPFIPFVLVLLVIGLQLLPMIIGGFLYATVVANGIAVGTFEHIAWGVLFALLALCSIYMLCSSIFALYVVTLPDMTPMKALRSARQLVRYRRLSVFRKLLFLPVVLLLIIAIIMLPVVLLITPAAEWIYFVLTMVLLAIVHSYMYAFYRELLPHE